jgi:hypothetical protein
VAPSSKKHQSSGVSSVADAEGELNSSAVEGFVVAALVAALVAPRGPSQDVDGTAVAGAVASDGHRGGTAQYPSAHPSLRGSEPAVRVPVAGSIQIT